MVVFGDASGGKDSGDLRVRRLGLAITTLNSYDPCCIRASVKGLLVGEDQSVPRGELRAFLLARTCTAEHL
eukprot:5313666-Pyramimonas_sp.AAC.1